MSRRRASCLTLLLMIAIVGLLVWMTLQFLEGRT
jgi:hypothetical protein